MRSEVSLALWILLTIATSNLPVCAQSVRDDQDRTNVLFPLPDSSHFFDPSSFESGYTCPPCGCDGDESLIGKPGFCHYCGMRLIRLPSGSQGRIARFLSGAFRDSEWTGIYYQKFMYPAFVLGFLLGISLIGGLGKRSGNVFLGLILLSLSLYAFKNQLYGVSYGLTHDFNYLFLPISFISAIGPSLYFYLIRQTEAELELRSQDLIHFAPALVIFGLYLYLFLQEDHVKNAYLISPLDIGFAHYEQLLTILLIFGYGYFGCRRIAKMTPKNSENLVRMRMPDYVWSQRLSWSIIAISMDQARVRVYVFSYFLVSRTTAKTL